MYLVGLLLSDVLPHKNLKTHRHFKSLKEDNNYRLKEGNTDLLFERIW